MDRYYWLNEDSRTFLERGYLEKGQTPEERIREIGEAAEKILGEEGFADMFEDYMGRGFYSLSSPIWSNFGKSRGLPISCNSSYIDDDMIEILRKTAEVGVMTAKGAGTSGYFGAIRPRGSEVKNNGLASGPVHYMGLFDNVTSIVSQGNVRRGSFAAYLPVEHPDIMEFLQIREEGNAIQEMSIGVTITDAWMKDMIGGDSPKRKIWGRIVKKRFETGYPYLFFTDTVNKGAPQVYKDNNMKIYNSNLCSEIALHSSPNESYVCNLSSINLARYDDLIKTNAVETLVKLLDAVMTEYIEKTDGIPFMEDANRFARRQRALGIGTLGWHTYLQENSIAFDSLEAKVLNSEIHYMISKRAKSASKELAEKLGEPELLRGYGMRNVTLMAIAPTTSSSFILGQVSPSIEPLNSNYFIKDLAKGKFTFKNPALKEVLASYEKNDAETWKSILTRGGSVQHLEFLTDHERNVFKTFGEISQKEIVIQAAGRQRHIDQSQSLNVMIPPTVSAKEASDLLIFGWEQGVKTFYYQRSANPAQELGRSILNCASCEA